MLGAWQTAEDLRFKVMHRLTKTKGSKQENNSNIYIYIYIEVQVHGPWCIQIDPTPIMNLDGD